MHFLRYISDGFCEKGDEDCQTPELNYYDHQHGPEQVGNQVFWGFFAIDTKLPIIAMLASNIFTTTKESYLQWG